MGWLTGFEPVLKAPQAHVLPLHHSHHIRILVSSVRIERTTYGLEVRRSVLLSYEDVNTYFISKITLNSKDIFDCKKEK